MEQEMTTTKRIKKNYCKIWDYFQPSGVKDGIQYAICQFPKCGKECNHYSGRSGMVHHLISFHNITIANTTTTSQNNEQGTKPAKKIRKTYSEIWDYFKSTKLKDGVLTATCLFPNCGKEFQYNHNSGIDLMKAEMINHLNTAHHVAIVFETKLEKKDNEEAKEKVIAKSNQTGILPVVHTGRNSGVWRYFSSDGRHTALCQFPGCGKEYHHKSSTSGMIRHLFKTHNITITPAQIIQALAVAAANGDEEANEKLQLTLANHEVVQIPKDNKPVSPSDSRSIKVEKEDNEATVEKLTLKSNPKVSMFTKKIVYYKPQGKKGDLQRLLDSQMAETEPVDGSLTESASENETSMSEAMQITEGATKTPEGEVPTGNSVENIFQCGICNVAFFVATELQDHIFYGEHNFIVNNFEQSKFKCAKCGLAWDELEPLKLHVTSHFKQQIFRCKHCPRLFRLKSSQIAHSRTHQKILPRGYGQQPNTNLYQVMQPADGDLAYTCDVCPDGRAFSSKLLLQRHMLSHTEERPIACKFCGKSFRWRNGLTRHIESHKENKTFQCEFCGKIFPKDINLKQHLNTHTGVKANRCHRCSRSFAQKFDLQNHLKVQEFIPVDMRCGGS